MRGSRTMRQGLVAGAVLALALAPSVRANDALSQGVSAFKSGKYAEAAAEFQTLVDLSPSYDYGHFMLGLSLLKIGRTLEARDSIVEAIELNGDRFEYHNGLARVYVAEKDYARAIAVLGTAEPLATTDPRRFALFATRGSCYAALDKWSDAVEDLERARTLRPDQASVLLTLGQAYYKLGYFDNAVAVLREAVTIAPSDAVTLQWLAESLVSLGSEALSEGEKDGLYREALQYAERFRSAAPGDFEADNLVGRSALGASDFAMAEQAFHEVLDRKPDHCYAMVNLGKTYIAQERWNEAEGILNEAARCAPRMWLVYESLGFTLQKQDRLEEAVVAYEKAYEIKPSDGVRDAMEICRQNLALRQSSPTPSR